MIPAQHPYEARYIHKGEKTTYHTDMPVIAWDDDGHALVADDDTGQLRRADSYSNFDGIQPAEPPIVAAVPGGGWIVEFGDDNGVTIATPVVAWVIRSDGRAEPLDASSDGHCDDPRTNLNFLRVRHPDEQMVRPDVPFARHPEDVL